MDMKMGLFQQQTLKLTMTQELSQAITLLQYSAQELQEFLDNKLLENPLLSLEHPSQVTYEPMFRQNKKRTTQARNKDAAYWLEQIGEETTSIETDLLSQLKVHELTKQQESILLQLIHNLDGNGYLRIDIEEVAETNGISSLEVEECLKELQQLEPYGIAARNLQECLLIQARLDGSNELAEMILEHHFFPFVEKKWKGIAKHLGVSMQQIQGVFDYVQELNPRPGAHYSLDRPAYIVPDVVVENRGGRLVVGDYDGNSPRLNADKTYLKKLKESKDQNLNRYWQEKWQEYQWLSKGIQHRKETILNVMGKIAEKQTQCFLTGMNELKPMTMKEIADELGIHESTVSRAVKEKYVQTPFGTFEMREFFSSSLQSTMDEEISGKNARSALEKMISKEDKQKPLSDQELSARLRAEQGIVLSRRTVAKYRDQLGLPSSSKRKRYE
ncbi:RNA polymerase factor sigma-54 [Peribacillus psychrosaccharolyticus]|uniref:RNA polymerase factor sigma-54 n=1 Tax=Peribacillus psychrosaccharolyticus TaxID=1407 RepID=A0A974RZ66_PERPY|nr:RNA polymerase factor sigma-54 [Peribacillus psychrosaccharolyticus]MEC2055547.1 RNA polymerase factor sigma-54 [Peribacillus psychrosaccharolyticus]MED3743425.1 RNA polymerase factor sigma-54 [Peribacillus psychrosaccharolyticus]QQS99216.1 RNA polymerase factor sigma-54 [Peribacillus psychrosaccharolyticus]